MMIDISVIVTTYNQEDTVAETLESIKYQLKSYGKTQQVQLIVADDGSNDRTETVISRWLRENENIFKEVCTIFSQNNKGTCKNFANACRKASGKRIITIAGDDIWANTNVIETILECGEKDIIACPPLKFKQGKVMLNKAAYYSEIQGIFYDEKEIIKRSKFSCPIINGAVIGRKLYDNQVLEFSEQFDLLDDQTRFAKMFEMYQDFRYRYQKTPIMLYRISEMQVTNINNKLHDRIISDKVKLTEYMLKKEKNVFTRNSIKCEEMRITNPNKFERIWRFVYWGAYLDILSYKVNFPKIDAIADEMIKTALDNNMDMYVQEIQSRARKYSEY